MPKLPRISSREVIQALERLGFEQIRQTGSHVVMKKENVQQVNSPLPTLCSTIRRMNQYLIPATLAKNT